MCQIRNYRDAQVGHMSEAHRGFRQAGITVENGEVTEAWHFDMSTGQEVSAPFSNVEVVSPTELTLDSTYPLGEVEGSFTCEKD